MISLELLLASAIGLLTATGIYLILRARTFPVVLGLAMIGYAVNLFLFAMGRLQVNAPAVLTETVKTTDPLPQALVLTAIVIGFATTAFIVQLALRSRLSQEQTTLIQKKKYRNLTHVRMSHNV